MFGEEDILDNQRRTYSIKCISPRGIVRIISKKNFFQRVCVDKTSQNLIDQIKVKKLSWFRDKIKEIHSIFQSNSEILTQNLTKDFILNDFLKNRQKKSQSKEKLQENREKNAEKMRVTRCFRLKSHNYSNSLEVLNYSAEKEKEEFLRLKSQFEEKQFGKAKKT